jgi:hypothetical protein
MVIHAYNSNTGEAEVGGLRVQGNPGLHSEIFSQKKKEKRERRPPGEEPMD